MTDFPGWQKAKHMLRVLKCSLQELWSCLHFHFSMMSGGLTNIITVCWCNCNNVGASAWAKWGMLGFLVRIVFCFRRWFERSPPKSTGNRTWLCVLRDLMFKVRGGWTGSWCIIRSWYCVLEKKQLDYCSQAEERNFTEVLWISGSTIMRMSFFSTIFVKNDVHFAKGTYMGCISKLGYIDLKEELDYCKDRFTWFEVDLIRRNQCFVSIY